MQIVELVGKSYKIDADEFLLDSNQWDADFAEEMARRNGMAEGLSASHWRVLNCIRDYFSKEGTCPTAFDICKACGLSLAQLANLFPMDNKRSAYKIAGIPYFSQYPAYVKCTGRKNPIQERVYRIDIEGFLVDPDEWDCDYVIFRMRDMNIPEASDLHFDVIQFLRKQYYAAGRIPTVEQICAANEIDTEDFGALFPGDFYRAAIKVAGLRPAAPGVGN
ncbi:MAG: TusE/DsrC/DsvC family sulfur relay protein [Syntrophobacteraceae bacterium]|nr:TusE/DsrC/DsvC family sulfur relay protein [Syntrophobacteraceae bacterium]